MRDRNEKFCKFQLTMFNSYRLNGYYRWHMTFLLFSLLFPWTCPMPVERKCTLRGKPSQLADKGKCVQNLTCLRQDDKFEVSWVPSKNNADTLSYFISLFNSSNTDRALVLRSNSLTFEEVKKDVNETTIGPDEIDNNVAYYVRLTRKGTGNKNFFTKAGCKDMGKADGNTLARDIEETTRSQKIARTTLQHGDGNVHVSDTLNEFHTDSIVSPTITSHFSSLITSSKTVDDMSTSYREKEVLDIPQSLDASEYKMPIIFLSCVVSGLVIVAILLIVLIKRRRRNADEEKTEMIQVNANPSSSFNVVDSRKDHSNSKDIVANETEEYKQTSHTGKQSGSQKEPNEDRLQKETEYISHSRTQNENQHEENNGSHNNRNEQKDDTYDNPNEQDNGISDKDDVYHHLSYSRKNTDDPGEQEDDTYAHAQSSEYDTFKRHDHMCDESEHYSISN